MVDCDFHQKTNTNIMNLLVILYRPQSYLDPILEITAAAVWH